MRETWANEIAEMKKEYDRLVSERERAAGAVEALEAKILQEYEVESIEEAETLLEQLEKELEQLEKELEQEIETYREKWQETLSATE